MLLRKLFRTAWGYKSQFISMIIMITLGMGMFLGFNMEWKTIEYDTGRFFKDTNYADYRLYAQEGFTADDLEAVKEIKGITEATRFLSVNLDVKGEKGKALAVDVSENYTVSTFLLSSGEKYDKNGLGFWLSDKYAAENGLKTGDTLTLQYKGLDIKGKITGLIKSGEHMICLADTNQLMPDYKTFGYAYISPAFLSSIVEENCRNILRKELLEKGASEETIDKAVESALTEEALKEATDKTFVQINLISDLKKAELEEKVKNALGRTIMVTSKDDHVVYKEANGEADEGKTMGSVLPVLFLAIAILTMVTTMHRIATKEKLQIGTLKALGFKNRRILLHYTSYGLFIGLVGTAFGTALGYGVCKAIMSEKGLMGTYFDMPYWDVKIPAFCYPVMAATVVFLTLISFLSVRNQLRGSAADALRPYSPKKMKKSLIERLGIFSKMHFGVRWNIRDLSRHKSRSAMTVIGIVGCMVLMVGGLGMKDTMSGFLDLLDNEISAYTTKVNIAETADKQTAITLAESLDGDWESLSGISLDGETETLDIVHNENCYYNIIDESNERIKLSDEGVYLCLRLKDKAKIGEEISFSPYGSKKTYTAKVIGYNRSIITESVTMTDKLADKLGIEYTLSAIYTDKKAGEIAASSIITGKQDQQKLMETFTSFVSIMDGMVVMLIIAAVILGVVVLYNLGVMSYVERSRELATLKVLGFRNKAIGKLIISQNIWLTVIGVVIGLPAGVGTLKWLLIALGSEYELPLMLGVLTYSVSTLLTFGVSLLVGLAIQRKNKKIDMVEALKIND